MTNITQEERLEWREHFDEVIYQNNRAYNVLYHNVKKIKLKSLLSINVIYLHITLFVAIQPIYKWRRGQWSRKWF